MEKKKKKLIKSITRFENNIIIFQISPVTDNNVIMFCPTNNAQPRLLSGIAFLIVYGERDQFGIIILKRVLTDKSGSIRLGGCIRYTRVLSIITVFYFL